jgi:two-component system response regulator RegA
MSLAPQKMLLVDDDPIFLHVLSRAMSKRGYEIYHAENEEDALALEHTHNFDFAVIDLKLEHSSGLQLLVKLKEANENIRVLVLTGYSSIATAVDAIKLGAANYLCKPADADEILQAFDTASNLDNTNITATPPSVNRLEWEHIQKVLHENEGNISATARALGMHRRTLQRKLLKRPVKN